MNATTQSLAVETSSTRMSTARLIGAYLEEIRSECVRYLRAPSFLLPTLLFPTVFYLMFGIFLGKANGPDAPRFFLAAYSTFGVMAPGLFGFGVSLAIERDGGLLLLKRALPMPPAAYLFGKMVMALLSASAIVALLLGMALVLAHVPLTFAQATATFFTSVLGVLPFCAMGLFVGSLIKGQGAPGVINLIYLPMAFLSGLWFPLTILPGFLQQLGPVWPSYHLNQLALNAVGLGQEGTWIHVGVLAIYTAVFIALAARRLRRHG
ncbi:MAG TPA: ABC transporter permease [Dyella sp.]|uniref:ABC transporter permease n=1 Tax=Dyella sp. TaxID=1869338 RepID=UPI002F92F972